MRKKKKMSFDLKYQLALRKNDLADRLSGFKNNRKKFFSAVVTILMLVLLPATVWLASQTINPQKQAATCSGNSSFITFTDLNGNTITSAKTGDKIRAHIYVTGQLDAADLSFSYDNARISYVADSIYYVSTPIAGGYPRGNEGFYFSLRRSLGSSQTFNGEVGFLDFNVVATNATTAEILYVSPTLFARGGNAVGEASCGRTASLILNQAAAATGQPTNNPTSNPTSTPTSVPATPHPCPNYQTNCLNLKDCPSGRTADPLGQCGVGFKCCLPSGTEPTSTPTSVSGNQCPNYQVNCVKIGQSCPSGDQEGRCGTGFHCCKAVTIAPTPTLAPCPDYWSNCSDVAKDCPAGKVPFGGQCGAGFRCCVPE